MAEARRGAGETWYAHPLKYLERKWPELAANSRTSIAEALAVVTPTLVRSVRGKPDVAVLREALYGWAYNLNRRGPASREYEQALAWLRRTSVSVRALGDDSELVYAALDALSRKKDGQRAAPNTVRRKRAVFYNALGYAVVRKLLTVTPLTRSSGRFPRWNTRWTHESLPALHRCGSSLRRSAS